VDSSRRTPGVVLRDDSGEDLGMRLITFVFGLKIFCQVVSSFHLWCDMRVLSMEDLK